MKAPNPFVNIRDLRNIDALFRKLNDTMDKLELFKKKASGLPDIEIVKKKLEQFGQALGFVEDNVAKMDKSKREKMAMKSMAKSGIEKEYIQAMCEDTYKNLLELNQLIRRREIISNINSDYF